MICRCPKCNGILSVSLIPTHDGATQLKSCPFCGWTNKNETTISSNKIDSVNLDLFSTNTLE